MKNNIVKEEIREISLNEHLTKDPDEVWLRCSYGNGVSLNTCIPADLWDYINRLWAKANNDTTTCNLSFAKIGGEYLWKGTK